MIPQPTARAHGACVPAACPPCRGAPVEAAAILALLGSLVGVYW